MHMHARRLKNMRSRLSDYSENVSGHASQIQIVSERLLRLCRLRLRAYRLRDLELRAFLYF